VAVELRSGGQLQIFFVQTLLVFDVLRVLADAIDRAHFHALRFVVVTDAFGAQGRIDHVNVFALRDSAIGAFWFANVTIDAFIADD